MGIKGTGHNEKRKKNDMILHQYGKKTEGDENWWKPEKILNDEKPNSKVPEIVGTDMSVDGDKITVKLKGIATINIVKYHVALCCSEGRSVYPRHRSPLLSLCFGSPMPGR